MNSNYLRSFAYLFLSVSIAFLSVFTYLNQQRSKEIDQKISGVNVVVAQYTEQIDRTDSRLNETNEKISSVKRKINKMQRQLNSVSNNSNEAILNLVKKQLDDALGGFTDLSEKFNNEVDKIGEINVKIETISQRLNLLENSQLGRGALSQQPDVPDLSSEFNPQPPKVAIPNEANKSPKVKEEKEKLELLLDNFEFN